MRMLWVLLLCACLALASFGGAGDDGAPEPEPTPETELEISLDRLPASPEREGTHEDYVEGAQELLDAALASYARVNPESTDILEEYGPRLQELAATDLSSLSDADLWSLMLELSHTLTNLKEG